MFPFRPFCVFWCQSVGFLVINFFMPMAPMQPQVVLGVMTESLQTKEVKGNIFHGYD